MYKHVVEVPHTHENENPVIIWYIGNITSAVLICNGLQIVTLELTDDAGPLDFFNGAPLRIDLLQYTHIIIEFTGNDPFPPDLFYQCMHKKFDYVLNCVSGYNYHYKRNNLIMYSEGLIAPQYCN